MRSMSQLFPSILPLFRVPFSSVGDNPVRERGRGLTLPICSPCPAVSAAAPAEAPAPLRHWWPPVRRHRIGPPRSEGDEVRCALATTTTPLRASAGGGRFPPFPCCRYPILRPWPRRLS